MKKKHTHQLSSAYHDAAQFYLGGLALGEKRKRYFQKNPDL